ncbi:MAG: hypothetical protein A2W01_11140 [Candidatus Solincola sediminis]|nr:MAG: hypothetical protein A2W01_11140 [Candidatus Solincola sediminis]
MRGRAYLIILLSLMLPFAGFLAGCGGRQAIKEVTLQAGGMQEAFSLYYPVAFEASGRVPAYSISPGLSNVSGLTGTYLPADASSSLAQRGFIVIPGNEDRIADVYRNTSGAKFITVDAVLDACLTLNDYTMFSLENEILAEDLKDLVTSLLEALQGIYQGTQGTVREAALKDLGFVGVAARLLDLEAEIPDGISDAVDKEVSLISVHKGRAISPLFGSEKDYSIYSPEGYYLDEGDLERHFKAMTWLSQDFFSPHPGTSQAEVDRGRNSTRQALLLVAALHKAKLGEREALKIWDGIYQPAAFLKGVPNELNVYSYGTTAIEEFGVNLELSRFSDDSLIDSFIESVLELATISGLEDADSSAASFTLFAPKAQTDFRIFKQLVEPAVPERTMPRGLDIPAAYGSDRALDILDKLYKDTQYESYLNNIKSLRREPELNPLQTHSSVYSSVTKVLRVLLKPAPDGYPSFMRNASWQDKDVYSFLAGSTELKKSAPDFGLQTNPPAPGSASSAEKGYVEPRPEAFAVLAATVDTLRRGLSERGMAVEEVTDRLELLNTRLLSFKGIAEKELGNQPISAEEYQLISGFGDSLKYLTGFPVSSAESSLLRETGLIDDLYHDTINGEVLQAGLGKPNVYYVIVPVDGKLTLTIGGGFSYFESVKAEDQKLTDESWNESINSGQAPAQPAWCISFLK